MMRGRTLVSASISCAVNAAAYLEHQHLWCQAFENDLWRLVLARWVPKVYLDSYLQYAVNNLRLFIYDPRCLLMVRYGRRFVLVGGVQVSRPPEYRG